ncbi:transcriptional activator NhaR [Pyxidicoccus trucidator]|uniref:transcriptional activator NhaR n=1 Tax=Pyxidicoccus trucidator TaxID=2709662 RepID=UPI0013DBF657|nr:transcriptional activator NhaR [Pyxidicoccus trucidator]
MDWLNYHHLYYFWVVAKEGSIVAASKKLRLAHPTISGQIRRLEEVLGEKLFAHSGRNLVLTEAGRVALRYAEAIFTLGGEFLDTIKGRASGERPLRLVVGVADVLPPSLVRRFLEPALRSAQPVRLVCRADKSVVEFIAEMAVHTVDLVIADGPAGPNPVRVFNHLLGECGTTFFAAPKLAAATRRKFPRSLDGTPFLLPGAPSAVRRALDQWFESQDIHPRIVAEFDDSALMKDFGRQGMGVFAAPTVIEAEVMLDHGVRVVGRAEAIRQQFYAISSERKIRHPSVVAIFEAARQEIFATK